MSGSDHLSVRAIKEELGITTNEADSMFRKVVAAYGAVRYPGHRRVWVTRAHFDQWRGLNHSGNSPSSDASGGTT